MYQLYFKLHIQLYSNYVYYNLNIIEYIIGVKWNHMYYIFKLYVSVPLKLYIYSISKISERSRKNCENGLFFPLKHLCTLQNI